MMKPYQAVELLRKRSYWKRTMWIWIVISLLIIVIAVSISAHGIDQTYNDMIVTTGTVDGKKAYAGISRSLGIITLSLPFLAFSLLISLTAFIRLFSLPKLPKK